MRWTVLCHNYQKSSRFDVRAERERCPCTLLNGEFKQLLLACSEGCGLCDISFIVRSLLSANTYDALVSRTSPFTREEESGMPPLLELFCWNAINFTHFYIVLCLLMLCGDTNHGHRHIGCMHHVLLLSMVVVHVCILLPCNGHKICIFTFPRISGEKKNLSNGGTPDPSSL